MGIRTETPTGILMEILTQEEEEEIRMEIPMAVHTAIATCPALHYTTVGPHFMAVVRHFTQETPLAVVVATTPDRDLGPLLMAVVRFTALALVYMAALA